MQHVHFIFVWCNIIMQEDVGITFSNNIFLVGFRIRHEIEEVLKILACIHTENNIHLDEGNIITIFLTIPEEMLMYWLTYL